MATTTDYDAPRRTAGDEPANDAPVVLASAPNTANTLDDDLNEIPELFELPGADLSGEELTVTVIPQRSDEFMCTSCFLVQHRSRLAVSSPSGAITCVDCC